MLIVLSFVRLYGLCFWKISYCLKEQATRREEVVVVVVAVVVVRLLLQPLPPLHGTKQEQPEPAAALPARAYLNTTTSCVLVAVWLVCYGKR